MFSTSPFGKINYIDIYKSTRAGALVLVSTFGSAFVGAAPVAIQNGLFDPKLIFQACFIAGATAILDLIRRALTDYSAPQNVIITEKTAS